MSVIVQTTKGKVEGTIEGDAIVFKGIPYAQAPIGENRFRAPKPVEAWQGILRAAAYPNRALQSEWDLEEVFYKKEFYEDTVYLTKDSEDCLYLNIWTPIEESKESRPVAFFIHGGAFDHGTGHEVEFRSLEYAKKGVILVTFNYRLGLAGFMAHPQLYEEDPRACGNYGILDQMMALSWVKENIKAFGGNPENITIIGQSAGAVAVKTILSIEEADGMFAKAIIQSAGGYPSMLGKGHSLEEAYFIGRCALKTAGIDTVDELRSISESQLREVQEQTIESVYGNENRILFFEPCINGVLLKKSLDEMCESGHMSRVPAIIGVTDNDLLVTMDELKGGPSMMEQSCVAWGLMQAKAGGPDVYVYNFSRRLPGDDAGAFHSAELWYMFGTYGQCWRPMTWEDVYLSDRMVTYWTEFIRKGNPNHAGLPKWYPCCLPEQFVMKLDVETKSL